MPSGTVRERRITAADVLFLAFLGEHVVLSVARIPFDFTDLCYLFSLEEGRWVPQEWVHPIYVSTLGLLSGVLGLFGYHGHMLVPVEYLNVAATTAGFVLLYRLARRFPGSSLAAVLALAVTALCVGFQNAAIRPTPYALAFLFQTLSLSLLVSDLPVAPHRYGLAGVAAGVSMGFHASAMALAAVAVACALFEPDPARIWRTTLLRISLFAAGMLATAIACWATFLAYHSIGADYFRHQDFQSTFLGVEQVPGTSIYTSRSVSAQLSSFITMMGYQSGVLVRLGLAVAALAIVLRVFRGQSLLPAERRLAIATGANFAAIAGFFLINNTHNGFIFASFTLIPVLAAVTIRGSWVGLAALIALAASPTRDNVQHILAAHLQGENDPQLAEARFLDNLLQPRDVLLTPGTPFAEMLYLAHLNMFEVSTGKPAREGGPEVPVLRPGPVLRARVVWWLAHGGRVFYARGDDSTDFSGDVTGAEKEQQIFWRPETAARERAPVLDGLRAAIEACGLGLQDGVTSPRGKRYAEVRLEDSSAPVASPPPTPVIPATELMTLFVNDAGDVSAREFEHRAEFLVALDRFIPDDPWRACDVMELICEARPRVGSVRLSCQALPGCEQWINPLQAEADANHIIGGRDSCFFGPIADREGAGKYLANWVRDHQMGELRGWRFDATGDGAEMAIVSSAGTLALKWHLLDSCGPSAVEATPSDGLPARPISADELHGLVANLPVPKVRPGNGPNHM